MMKAWRKYMKAIPLVMLIIVVIILFPRLAGLEVSDVLLYTHASPMIAILVILGLYCLKSVTLIIPMAILYISAGAIFPPGWAIAVIYVGLFFEISIGYLIGRRLGSEKVAALIDKNKKTRRLLSINKSDSSVLCFLSRFLPLPPELASMFFGASDFPYPKFVAFSLLGMTPGMIPYVLMGDAVMKPISKEFLIPFAISVIIFVTTCVIYRNYRKNSV